MTLNRANMFQNLIYYDNDVHGYKIGVTKDSILESVDGILQGKVKAKHSENIIERFTRVCFS